MKLNDEMCEKALSSKGICTIYSDEYVLLKKAMPITDDKLDWYLNGISSLKSRGVNISSVVDYKLLPETTKSFKNVGSYTEGIFLEERAKGTSFDSYTMYLKPSKDYDFNEVISRYLKMAIFYIEELELRAKASQEIYEKLISDCQGINEAGLTIDPKPLNFFFDEHVGYTIIDVIPNDGHFDEENKKYFPQYMFSIVFGYGKPSLYLGFSDFSILPPQLILRLEQAGKLLEAKIVLALRKYGYSEEDIAIAVGKNKFRFESKLEPVNLEDMEEFLANAHMDLKKKEQANDNDKDDSDIFVISC